MSTENEVKDLNAMSDAELSECFAVEVAGWTKGPIKIQDYTWTSWRHKLEHTPEPPTFATDANAVLPWLEKYNSKAFDSSTLQIWGSMGNWTVRIKMSGWGSQECSSEQPTFPRAACCALIAAKRASK